jgi:predicted phosphate transport protein (TIGR00153 family)
MRLPLLPQEQRFYDLFRQDIATCTVGVDALDALLRDYRDLRQRAARLHEIEHEGDRITGEIFTLLSRSLMPPFEREDVIALGRSIDSVLDQVDELATMLVLYRVEQPTPYLLEATALLARAVAALSQAIDRLDSLTGIEPHVAEVHRLETEADNLYQKAIADLFLGGAYQPMEVIKWNRLYDLMERAADRCADVANVLRGMVLNNA